MANLNRIPIKAHLILVALFFLSLAAVSGQTLEDITFMTEEYPPYNYTEKGQLKGIFVDCLEWMLKDLGTDITRQDFRVVPWTGGYERVQNQRNTALFAMIRTEKREDLFRWVGPVSPSRVSLIARKDSNIVINHLEELPGYTIGVITNDIGEQILKETQIEGLNLESVTDPDMNPRKLAHHRIDLWAYGDDVAMALLKKNGFNPSEFETVYVLTENKETCFAFHRDTPQHLIDQLQTSLEKLRTSAEYQKIIDRYQ